MLMHNACNDTKLKINKTDLTSALWVCFWLVIAFTKDPDLLDTIIAWIGKQ